MNKEKVNMMREMTLINDAKLEVEKQLKKE